MSQSLGNTNSSGSLFVNFSTLDLHKGKTSPLLFKPLSPPITDDGVSPWTNYKKLSVLVSSNTWKKSRKLAQVWGFKKGKSSIVPRNPDVSHLRLDAVKLKKIADDLGWDTKLSHPEIIIYHLSDNEGKPMKMKKYWKGGRTPDASSVIYDVVCRPVAITHGGKLIVEISPPPQQGNPPPRLNAFYEAGLHYKMYDPVNCLIIGKSDTIITHGKPQPLTVGRLCEVFTSNISVFNKCWVNDYDVGCRWMRCNPRCWVNTSERVKHGTARAELFADCLDEKKKKKKKTKKKATVAPLPVAPVPPVAPVKRRIKKKNIIRKDLKLKMNVNVGK